MGGKKKGLGTRLVDCSSLIGWVCVFRITVGAVWSKSQVNE